MIAMMTTATSTSISVKPRWRAAGIASVREWSRAQQGRAAVVEDLGVDPPEVGVRRGPHDQLAVEGAAELLAGEQAVADVRIAAASFRPVSWLSAHHWAAVMSARRAVLLVSEPAALIGAERDRDDRERDQHLDQGEAAAASCSLRCRLVVADQERADSVGGERQPMVVEAKDDPLLADQRLGTEYHGARADHLRGGAGLEKVGR
jgi:hypothetical protein